VVGQAAGAFQHAGHVHQGSGHDGGVALGEFVVDACRAVFRFAAVRQARSRLANPAAIGLGRDGVAEMAEGLEDGHGAVL